MIQIKTNTDFQFIPIFGLLLFIHYFQNYLSVKITNIRKKKLKAFIHVIYSPKYFSHPLHLKKKKKSVKNKESSNFCNKIMRIL